MTDEKDLAAAYCKGWNDCYAERRGDDVTLVDRRWLEDFSASLEAGDVESCREALESAMKLIGGRMK